MNTAASDNRPWLEGMSAAEGRALFLRAFRVKALEARELWRQAEHPL